MLGCMAWLASCSNDENEIDTTPVIVQFAAGDIAVTKTTADGNQWTIGDKVGIFMIAKDATDISGNIMENADNIAYKAEVGDNSQSSFIPEGGAAIRYPANGDKVDFIAYYPHKTTLTAYTYPINVSNQTDPAAINVLYSNNAKNYDANSGVVNLQFGHMLSKLNLTLTPGVGLPSLAGAKVEIGGIATTASMELKNGSLTTSNSNQTVITNTAADGLTSSAIMIPQTLSGAKLIVTLADNVSKFEGAFDDFTLGFSGLEKGKEYNLTITVDKTSIIITTDEITDWTGTTDGPTVGHAGIWKVGDYYPDPNVVYNSGVVQSGVAAMGIVFWLDPSDSRHGKVVGLKEVTGRWGVSSRNESAVVTGIRSTTDGKNATQNLINIRRGESGFNVNYYAFNWIYTTMNKNSLNGVWYLPAKNELQNLLCAAAGKPLETWDYLYYPSFNPDASKLNKSVFNGKLTAAGGDALYDNVYLDSYYWSSSENAPNTVLVVNFQDGLTGDFSKGSSCRARCILAF